MVYNFIFAFMKFILLEFTMEVFKLLFISKQFNLFYFIYSKFILFEKIVEVINCIFCLFCDI